MNVPLALGLMWIWLAILKMISISLGLSVNLVYYVFKANIK